MMNITPMEISFVVLAVGLLSGWVEGRGGYRNAALGALLFEIASIIDGCDGENARLTYRISKLGGTFDIAGDAATFIFFFVNLPIGLYRSSRNDLWLALGALSFISMVFFYLQLTRFTKRTGIGNNIVAIVKDIEKKLRARASRASWTGSPRRSPLFTVGIFSPPGPSSSSPAAPSYSWGSSPSWPRSRPCISTFIRGAGSARPTRRRKGS